MSSGSFAEPHHSPLLLFTGYMLYNHPSFLFTNGWRNNQYEAENITSTLVRPTGRGVECMVCAPPESSRGAVQLSRHLGKLHRHIHTKHVGNAMFLHSLNLIVLRCGCGEGRHWHCPFAGCEGNPLSEADVVVHYRSHGVQSVTMSDYWRNAAIRRTRNIAPAATLNDPIVPHPATTQPAPLRMRPEPTLACRNTGCHFVTYSRARLEAHARGCGLVRPISESSHLSFATVNPTGLSLVRIQRSGSDHRTHCHLGNKMCSQAECAIINAHEEMKCAHLLSIERGTPSQATIGSLNPASINALRDVRLPVGYTTAVLDKIEQMRAACDRASHPLVVEMSQTPGSLRNFSVALVTAVGEVVHSSRALVVFSNSRKHGPSWKCHHCSPARSCIHVAIAHWMAYERPVERVEPQAPAVADDAILDYWLQHKRIPISSVQLPCRRFTPEDRINLTPSETECPYGCLPSKKLVITSWANAKLFDLDGIFSVKVFIKQCPDCGRCIHYKDSHEGILNYDNTVLLSCRLYENWYINLHFCCIKL